MHDTVVVAGGWVGGWVGWWVGVVCMSVQIDRVKKTRKYDVYMYLYMYITYRYIYIHIHICMSVQI
jgi:hypothetical protein